MNSHRADSVAASRTEWLSLLEAEEGSGLRGWAVRAAFEGRWAAIAGAEAADGCRFDTPIDRNGPKIRMVTHLDIDDDGIRRTMEAFRSFVGL